jgi:hypothetical protein
LRSAESPNPVPKTMLPDLDFETDPDLETSRKRPKTERGRSVVTPPAVGSALVESPPTVCRPVGVIGRDEDCAFSTRGIEDLLSDFSSGREADAKAGAIVRGEETDEEA